MNVGLPGTGIGGLFYLSLAALMPAHALWRTLRGRASAWGWKMAALPAIAGLILFALWAEGWALRRALTCTAARAWLHAGMAREAYARVVSAQSSVVALTSAGTLAAVLIVVHGVGCCVTLRRTRPTAPAEASRRGPVRRLCHAPRVFPSAEFGNSPD